MRWYDPHLGVLGALIAFMGVNFYFRASMVEAPMMPYAGLVAATLGLWMGFVRPISAWRRDRRS